MSKRMIKIGKRSFPLWVIIVSLLAVSGIAIAAFLASVQLTANLSAGVGVNIVFSDLTCGITGSGKGVIDECSLVDGVSTMSISELDDESVVRWDCLMENLDGISGYFHGNIPDPATIPGVSAIDWNIPEGYELTPGSGQLHMTMYIYLTELTSGQVLDPIAFEFAFADTP